MNRKRNRDCTFINSSSPRERTNISHYKTFTLVLHYNCQNQFALRKILHWNCAKFSKPVVFQLTAQQRWFRDHAWFLILRKNIWICFSNLVQIAHLGQIPFSPCDLVSAGLICSWFINNQRPKIIQHQFILFTFQITRTRVSNKF